MWNKKIIKYLCGAIITIILLIVIYTLCNTFSVGSKEKILEFYTTYEKEIISVSKYITDLPYENVYLPNSDVKKDNIYLNITDTKNESKQIIITDGQIRESIFTLVNSGKLEVILKTNGNIYFQKWSNLKYGRGILYSINGEVPQNELLIKLEPLDENGWYFYEEE